MKGDETENKKIGCTVNLLVRCVLSKLVRWNCCHVTSRRLLQTRFVSSQNFYKSEINKEEMYIRYIHKLCDIHLQAENFTGTVTHTRTLTHVHAGTDACSLHRGRLHSAAVLGAASLGGTSSQRVPALSCSDRVAPQGRPVSQSNPLLQQGQGERIEYQESIFTCMAFTTSVSLTISGPVVIIFLIIN